MIGNDQPRFQPADRIKSASMATGYRFRVASAQVKGSELTLRVTNDGVAPLYRDAFFAAGEKRSTTSLRGLLPGETIQCSIPGVTSQDLKEISIQCDAILATQAIQFDSE
ncbi:hypothetical protein [Rubripirellula tenax]|uniref:hypothetical protein n=1 Tax=Rubripirellula tenax TaxID=2528015 RepID=UPI0011B67BE4|nr:hypothetical protein [Rubripirellula tenax]